MNLELGRQYNAILSDESHLIFTFIGGRDANILLEDGNTIPLQMLPPYQCIEPLSED